MRGRPATTSHWFLTGFAWLLTVAVGGALNYLLCGSDGIHELSGFGGPGSDAANYVLGGLVIVSDAVRGL
eukprot:4946511-Pyramimonas_sp.AAC.1